MMRWKMGTCVDGDSPVINGEFNDPDDWRAWLHETYPDIINDPAEGFVADGEVFKQYGTNYRWSSLVDSEAVR